MGESTDTTTNKQLCVVLSFYRLITAESPITTQFAGDVTLSCLFPSQPGMNLQHLTLTWQKEQAGTEVLVVHSHNYGKDQLARQDEAYRNRTRLDPEGLARGNASLTLRGVRTQDEGVYRCHVTSEQGTTSETRQVTVMVQSAPDVVAHFGGDVTLSCLFLSEPGMNLQRLNLTWQKERAGAEALVVHSHYYGRDQLDKQDEAYRNRTQLDPEGLARGNASLMLRDVHMQDEGVYLCHITSELGRTSALWELKVAAPFSEPQLTFNLSSAGVTLTVHTGGGYPAATVRWLDEAGRDVTAEGATEQQVDEQGLYHVTSWVTVPPATHSARLTFVLTPRVLGAPITRPLSLQLSPGPGRILLLEEG
ncbi:methylmalonyl-CoA carboxyltransferase [Platysternon megacephalum]|uniref:Methylmalonyl-CoA carboxyltransferase n=1 Tax=Platysternon megacephalum TaxID=55544 RepID=A0A4D9DG29_9SAUR|nr:methylmalonyl-CoA carboxyltransferase [Platysternon megacephalum]